MQPVSFRFGAFADEGVDESHVGNLVFDGFGFCFDEILVVDTEGDAFGFLKIFV